MNFLASSDEAVLHLRAVQAAGNNPKMIISGLNVTSSGRNNYSGRQRRKSGHGGPMGQGSPGQMFTSSLKPKRAVILIYLHR